jgi:hypothetical protein
MEELFAGFYADSYTVIKTRLEGFHKDIVKILKTNAAYAISQRMPSHQIQVLEQMDTELLDYLSHLSKMNDKKKMLDQNKADIIRRILKKTP